MDPMRIEPNAAQRDVQSYATKRVAADEQPRTSADAPAAEVSISPEAQELQRYIRAAQSVDDIRHDRVDDIRTQLRSGAYQLDPHSIATKMLGGSHGGDPTTPAPPPLPKDDHE